MSDAPVTALQTAKGWLTLVLLQLDLPGLILLALLGVMVLTLVKAQRADGFDIKESMQDDAGKVSFLRVCGLGAFAVSSWVVMKDTISSGGANPWIFGTYIAFWSGAPVAGKFLEVLASTRSPKPDAGILK